MPAGRTRGSGACIPESMNSPGSPPAAQVRWRLVALLSAIILLSAGCLGPGRRDSPAEAIALSAHDALELPVRQRRAHWLLREASGWTDTRLVAYGGDADDPGTALVYAACFRSAGAAERAHARLTASYLHGLWHERMTGEPHPAEYPEPLPGDQVAVLAYPARLPPEWRDSEIFGQLTAVQAGRVVFLIDSIGVTPDRFVPAVAALVHAARQPGTGPLRACCFYLTAPVDTIGPSQ